MALTGRTLIKVLALILGICVVFLVGVVSCVLMVAPSGRDSSAVSAPVAAPAQTPSPGLVGVDPDPPEMVARATKLVANAERLGVIRRWTCIGNEAYVDPLLWARFDIDQKRGIARSLAIACHAKDSGRRMTIKSQQSGKTLATFSHDDIAVE